MFKYTREALFPYEDILKLDYVEEEYIKNYFIILNNVKQKHESLNNELIKYSEKLYKEGNKKKLKIVSNFRRKVKCEKIVRIPSFFPEIIADMSNKFFETIKNVQKMELFIKNKFFSKDFSYQYFLDNIKFQEAIKYTNPKIFSQIFDEKKYVKGKYKKTRYSYIQRNILKTNSISWMGMTSVGNEEATDEIIEEQIILNQYFITALLFLVANDPKLRKEMKFTTGTFASREGIDCFIQSLYYTSLFSNSFLVRENVLFNKDILHILRKISPKINLCGEYLTSVISKEKKFDFEFLIKNFVFIPDFKYYSQESHLNELLSKSETPTIKNIAEQITKNKYSSMKNYLELSLSDESFIATLDRYYFSKPLLEIIKNEPIWINQVINKSVSKAISIFDTKFNNYSYLRNCVQISGNYEEICQLINQYSQNNEENLLNILLKIEGELIYRTEYWHNSTSKSNNDINIDEEKTYLVMFNTDRNGEVYLNNVYPGNGFLLGREFYKAGDKGIPLLESYIDENIALGKKIYEVVIDPEISSLINTGKTNYPKLHWPEDFKNMKVSYENKLKFFYKGDEIHPIYFGSVPIHFFSGAKGLLLKILSPWGMAHNVKKIICESNARKSLDVSMLDITSCKASDELTIYLNVLNFFFMKDFPVKFFMKKKGDTIQKPLYISLLNKEGYDLFIHTIRNYEVTLTELRPNISTYSNKEKLIEHINIITEKEIIDNVEKLSHI